MCSLAGKNFTGSVLPVSAKCLVKRLFQRPRPTGRSNPKGAGARWRLDQLAWAGMCALSSCCSRCGGGGNFTLPTLIFCSCLQDGLCHTRPPRLRGDVARLPDVQAENRQGYGKPPEWRWQPKQKWVIWGLSVHKYDCPDGSVPRMH